MSHRDSSKDFSGLLAAFFAAVFFLAIGNVEKSGGSRKTQYAAIDSAMAASIPKHGHEVLLGGQKRGTRGTGEGVEIVNGNLNRGKDEKRYPRETTGSSDSENAQPDLGTKKEGVTRFASLPHFKRRYSGQESNLHGTPH